MCPSPLALARGAVHPAAARAALDLPEQQPELQELVQLRALPQLAVGDHRREILLELLATVSARQLRGVLGAYAASDDALEPPLRKKEPSKEPLVAAVRAAIARRADAGFARYDQLVFSK